MGKNNTMNKLKIYILLVFIYLLFFTLKSQAAEPDYFFSPGLKIGYQFGEYGGFVFGFDFSVMRTVDYFPNVGAVFSFEKCNGSTKLHLGAQTAHIVGLDIGPTIHITENKTNYGYSLGLYSLLIVMPFYEYTQMFDDKNYSFSQTGVFLKAPIALTEFRLNLAH